MIRPTTPTGSRVISTSMPGRTEAIFSPARRSAFAGEELEDLPGAHGFADALRQRLALLARQQPAELVLARQDFVPTPSSGCRSDLRRRPRPGRECGLRGGDRGLRAARVPRTSSPTMSLVLEGLTLPRWRRPLRPPSRRAPADRRVVGATPRRGATRPGCGKARWSPAAPEPGHPTGWDRRPRARACRYGCAGRRRRAPAPPWSGWSRERRCQPGGRGAQLITLPAA